MRRPLAIGFLNLAAAGMLSAQAAPGSYQDVIRESRLLILDTMTALRVPGAQIAVVRDGVLLWSEGFGLADIEQQVPVTPLTRFRIASISKPVTSTALGLLVQEGKVDLDAPVQRYVPSFPEKRWPITVRQVAGHLAGIRHYNDGEFENMRHYASVREGLTIFENDSLLFEPGTRFSYSSYGWNLVSAVVEGASGVPFLEFMSTRVFGPMGMTRTLPEFADSVIPWRAHAYVHPDSGGAAENAPYVDNSYKWAGGGFLSTAEDLARLGRNLLAGRVLSRNTVDLLWTSQTTRDGKLSEYGIGWSVRRDSAGRLVIGHTGGAMGGTGNFIIYPEQHLVLALLINSDVTFLGLLPKIGERFLQVVPD